MNRFQIAFNFNLLRYNTDAEGRVVLGDGVAFASGPLACDDVIDMVGRCRLTPSSPS
jgi:hypothetical protein